MNILTLKNGVSLFLDKSIYSLNILHKCFYWYGASYDIVITDFDKKYYNVELISKYEDLNPTETISKIKRDLIDFKLRDTVTNETRIIRELIIAKAFACYDDSLNPTTDLSDPVGFDPLSI